jgi:hypothetical protein
MRNSASCPSHGFPIPEAATKVGAGLMRSIIHRRISPQAGRALEILGHAIDYLIDEGNADGSATDPESGRTQAIQLLMAINREIYCACPALSPLGERLHCFLHSHHA